MRRRREDLRLCREADDGGGVGDVDVPGVVGGVEGDAEGVIEAGGELFDVSGFAVGVGAAEDEDGASLRVGEEEVAVGGEADEARHDEGALGRFVGLLGVLFALHGRRVATGVEGDLVAGGRLRPGTFGAVDDGGAIVDGFGGVWAGGGRLR